MSWTALAQLPHWAQASPTQGQLLSTSADGTTYLLGSRASHAAQETSEVVHVCFKEKDLTPKRLLIDVRWPQEPAAFEHLLAAAGGRAVALCCPSCCAVALTDAERVEALVLVPPEGKSFKKVLWHPLSDAHLGVLYDDGAWCLMDLSQSLEEPELHFETQAVDFIFAPQASSSPEDVWLSLSVFFLAADGHVSLRSPVLPAMAVMARRALENLLATASEPFSKAMVQSLSVTRSPTGDELVVVTHRQHLHGEMMSLSSLEPREIHLEESSDGKKFSVLELYSTSPLLMLARATPAGVVELVALESAIGPEVTSITACVVEEVDLLCHADDWLRLFPAPGGVFAFTKSLLAFLEGDRSCSVTTLAETRKDLEFVSFCPVESHGLLLRRERGRGKPALKVIELQKKEVQEAAKAATSQLPRPHATLRLLEQPLAAVHGSGATASELAARVAKLRGALGSIQCRQEFLKHLSSSSFPARAEAIKQELLLDTSELTRRSGAAARRAQALQTRQAELVARQQGLVSALGAASEAASLQELNDTALPKLYAQLYELRRAGELLKSARLRAWQLLHVLS